MSASPGAAAATRHPLLDGARWQSCRVKAGGGPRLSIHGPLRRQVSAEAPRNVGGRLEGALRHREEVTITTPGVALLSALGGAVGGAAGTHVGLRRLDPSVPSFTPMSFGAAIGLAAGVAAWRATERGPALIDLLGLLIGGAALAAAATCDLVTLRVPTGLVRQASVAALLLHLAAAVGSGTPRLAVVPIIAAVMIGGLLAFLSRLAGTGMGDVRLGLLGALGLSTARPVGLIVGLCTTLLVAAGLASRARRRQAGRYALGPALALGMLLAMGW